MKMMMKMIVFLGMYKPNLMSTYTKIEPQREISGALSLLLLR